MFRLKRHIKSFVRACSWFKFMYSNYEWDFSYLLEVIEKKLKEMEDFYAVPGNTMLVNSKKTGNEIARCRKLITKFNEKERGNEKNLEKAFDIMRERVRYWWD